MPAVSEGELSESADAVVLSVSEALVESERDVVSADAELAVCEISAELVVIDTGTVVIPPEPVIVLEL